MEEDDIMNIQTEKCKISQNFCNELVHWIYKIVAWLVFVETILNLKKQSLLYKSQFFIDIQKTQICYFVCFSFKK